MIELTNTQWQEIITQFCHECYMFWKREGFSVAASFDKARREALKLTHYPFAPKGVEIDKKALQKWSEIYNTDVVKTLYKYERGGTLQDLRLCDHCGFPIFDGYYIAAQFFCCEKCAIDGSYGGNKEQFEKDLKQAQDKITHYTIVCIGHNGQNRLTNN